MLTERQQRQLDRLLDEAEEALVARDWDLARARCETALAIDPENADALGYVEAAQRGASVGSSAAPSQATVTSPTPAMQLPDSFAGGRYRVERFLGEGGKKRVFLAHDTTLDRDVAFGQFRTEGMDAAGRARVTQEAQAMGRVGAHPNLVAIYDVGEEAGASFIVQEYVPGGSLADLIAEEPPPPLEQTLRLASDVCTALSFIHGQNLVHRDIKPSNVFLTEDGSAKVGDFGLAVGLDRTRITMQGGMIGTPSYMPPEQALSGDVTPQSDLYSLGAMLYELVTGRPPFVGDDPTSVISQHINTPPVAPSWHSEHCPPELEELILRCLAKSPDDRPASADEVREALAHIDPEARSRTHSDSGANPLDRLARGVFVGREAELERLRSAFDEAFAGRGSVVMLVGEPGIGKTRTTQELVTYVRMRAGLVLWGGAQEATGAPPYWPWVLAARSYRDQVAEEERRRHYEPYAVDLQRIFPGLRDIFPGLAEPPPLDSEEGQFRLFDALSSFLRGVAVDKPLLIVLDDLHWADRATLLMLTHLARELAHARILVVGTYRDTDLDRQHPLSRTLAELNRAQLFTRIPLRGLSRSEVGDYIRASAQFEPSPELVVRVHEETEGNAFFLHEVVNLMAQEGSFEKASLSDVAIPEGVKEALGRRLDRLSPEANELLSIAAVLGREFEHAELASVAEQSEAELLELVEEALAARVLEETGQVGGYRFTHALMRETLLGELSAARRVLLHGQVAEALEQLSASDRVARASRLAHHYAESSVLNDRHRSKAGDYAEAAAHEAEGAAAWDEAVAHYERALAFWGESESPGRRVDALVGLGRALTFRPGSFEPAQDAFAQAMDVLRQSGDGHRLAEVALAALETRGLTAPERAALTAEASQRATESDDAVLEASIQLAGTRWLSAERRGAITRAHAVLEAHPDPALRARLLSVRAVQALEEWDLDEAARLGREAFVAHDAVGTLVGARNALYFQVALTHLMRGDLTAFVEAAERADAFERAHHLGSLARLGLATVSLWRGDPEGAEALFEGVRAWSSDRVSALAAATLAAYRGDLGTAHTLLANVPVERVDTNAGTTIEGFHAAVLGSLGRVDKAAEVALSTAETLHAHLSSPPAWGERATSDVTGATTLGELAALLPAELLEGAYQRLVQVPQLRATTFPGGADGSADRSRGSLALRLDLVDEAEQHFRTGLEWCERERLPVEAGRCHQGLAEVAECRGNHALAMQHLDVAGEVFGRHGAKLFLDEVLAKKLELQGAGSADSGTSLISLTASLEADRPDVASAVAPDGTVTLLFSDIEDSTKHNVELGDDGWMRLLGEHNRLVRDAIREHRGFEVKTEGDAFMVAFQSARDAVRCAQAMQRALDARTEEPRLRIRIGLHTGEPVREADDFYGTHVVLASLICSQASGGEILVSSLLRDLVAASGEFTLDPRAPVAFKGLDGEHVTYAVGWQSL